jgi:hypothetical protein
MLSVDRTFQKFNHSVRMICKGKRRYSIAFISDEKFVCFGFFRSSFVFLFFFGIWVSAFVALSALCPYNLAFYWRYGFKTRTNERIRKEKTEMSYRISNVSRHMARFMRTQSSPPSSTRGGGGLGGNVSRNNISSSSSSNSRSSSRQEQIFCNNNNNGTGIVSRPTNNNAGVGSLRSFASSASRTGEIAFADVVAAQRQNRKSARALVAFALEGLKMEAATMATNVNMVDLDEIILSTDSIGLFEEIEDT